MNPDYSKLIKQIEQRTGLKFQQEIEEGNLCYRNNNEDLRDDFKEVFSTEDLKAYIRYFNGKEIQLPTDNLDFWKKVKAAKN
ncbi:MAG: hypothetical protein H3C39_09085 [Flavobacteriia bacterium]|nr:hypothetical protein [Flavobacteriia bacterium]